jgi:hypothetical protein
MGVSTGGAIALQLAVDHPDAVNRLIVVAAASWLGEAGRIKLREYAKCIEQGKSGAGLLASVLAPPWIRWLAAATIWINERSERNVDPGNMLATIDAECGFDVTRRLGEIKSPTLVIGGTRDRAFSPELFRATAEGIPGARLVLYQGRGHLGTMLDPRFGRDVAAFLRGCRRGSMTAHFVVLERARGHRPRLQAYNSSRGERYFKQGRSHYRGLQWDRARDRAPLGSGADEVGARREAREPFELARSGRRESRQRGFGVSARSA